MKYKMSKEEKEYLDNYRIADFERPSVATDIVVFTMGQEVLDSRKHPVGRLRVLLLNRASFPYKGYWSLPGGFCQPNEEVYETARRVLCEETGIEDAYLNISGVYGEVDRDPRGWIISHSFMALIDGEKCSLRTDADAWEARWFDVDITKEQMEKNVAEEEALVKNRYRVVLKHKEILMTNTIVETKIYKNCHETVTYEVSDLGDGADSSHSNSRSNNDNSNNNDGNNNSNAGNNHNNKGLAFDHAKIILQAFLNLQKFADHDEKIVFDLMPELFTLTELQKVFEIILQKGLLKANFRRKIKDYVLETDEVESGKCYRTAKLFKRNVERFYEM